MEAAISPIVKTGRAPMRLELAMFLGVFDPPRLTDF